MQKWPRGEGPLTTHCRQFPHVRGVTAVDPSRPCLRCRAIGELDASGRKLDHHRSRQVSAVCDVG